jgi:hypothetical protein
MVFSFWVFCIITNNVEKTLDRCCDFAVIKRATNPVALYDYAFTKLLGISSRVSAFQNSPRPLRVFYCLVQQVHVHAAPLLEEKWDLGFQALIPNVRDPFLHDWLHHPYILFEHIIQL